MSPGIFLIEFASQYEAAATMMRLQEHYESPNEEFRRRPFSREEYEDWYTRERGSFTYYQDWAGFNVPSPVVRSFRRPGWAPYTRREQELLGMLPGPDAEFYVIATDDPSVIAHELAHALWYLDHGYARSVRHFLRDDARVAVMREKLSGMGYHGSVLDDELNAYLLTGLTDELDGRSKIRRAADAVLAAFDLGRTHELRDLRRALGVLFRRAHGFDITTSTPEDLLRHVRVLRFPQSFQSAA